MAPFPHELSFIELQQVDSTNNYATALVHAGMAQHGSAVFAHQQNKGRGQRNKQWLSQAGQNIALSIIFQPVKLVTSQVFLLSMAVAVAGQRWFRKYAGEDVKIKWPNDLYWRDRKAGGILIENILHGSDCKYAIAGIGVNINQTVFEELAGKAVSLKQITGKNFEPLDLAKELHQEIFQSYEELLLEPERIKGEYLSTLYGLNQKVRLKKGSRVFEAEVLKVTSQGQLVVKHATEEYFDVGEVEWII